LLAGWLAFLARVLPQVTISWSGVGMVVVSSALFLVGLQSLCQWLYSHWVRQGSAGAEVSWRWSWTACLYGVVWLLFLAAMGVTGMVHQVGWLAATREPIYVERGTPSRIQLRIAAMESAMFGGEEGWKLVETRRAIESARPAGGRSLHPIEDLHVLYLEGMPGKLAAIILFHRDQKKRD